VVLHDFHNGGVDLSDCYTALVIVEVVHILYIAVGLTDLPIISISVSGKDGISNTEIKPQNKFCLGKECETSRRPSVILLSDKRYSKNLSLTTFVYKTSKDLTRSRFDNLS